jgi:hypothetical protein
MPPTLTYTLANGQSADATAVMANFQDIVDYFTAGIPLADLAKPKALFAKDVVHLDTIAAGASELVMDFRVPTGQTWTIVNAQFSFASISSTPTVALEVTDDTVSIFSSSFTGSTADSINERTSFASDTIAAGSRVKATISVTGGTSATDFYVNLLFKVDHQS